MDRKRREIWLSNGGEASLNGLSAPFRDLASEVVGPNRTKINDRNRELMRMGQWRFCSGMTLLELVFAVAACAILAMLAAGQIGNVIDRSRSAAARADIVMMEVEIQRFRTTNDGALPDSLVQIGRANYLDPWKRPYYYTKLAGTKGHGGSRKDHKLNPLNTDFDLFSAGKDGVFKPQVSQKDSLDDIIRARDGAFIGLASDF